MAVDRSNEEIAADLFIAIPTVKTHINHIRRKLGQTTRVGAVLEYQRLRATDQR
jgi:DNA-binding CsgD family transcriptional regulator